MNEFLRKLSALAICVTLAELLLPQGGVRQAARLSLTLLVTLLMAGALMELLAAVRLTEAASSPAAMIETALAESDAQTEERYRRTALTAWANQLAERCERLCRSVGYEAQATACLQTDGSVHHVALRLLSRDDAPLYSPAELPARLCEALGLTEGQVYWQDAPS